MGIDGIDLNLYSAFGQFFFREAGAIKNTDDTFKTAGYTFKMLGLRSGEIVNDVGSFFKDIARTQVSNPDEIRKWHLLKKENMIGGVLKNNSKVAPLLDNIAKLDKVLLDTKFGDWAVKSLGAEVVKDGTKYGTVVGSQTGKFAANTLAKMSAANVVLLSAFELPSVYNEFKEGDIKDGMKQVIKSGANVTAGVALAGAGSQLGRNISKTHLKGKFGTALSFITAGITTLIGCTAVDKAGKAILGESIADKKRKAKELEFEKIENTQENQIASNSANTNPFLQVNEKIDSADKLTSEPNQSLFKTV